MVSLVSVGRKKCGGCIVLIGLILIIPSILIWITAEKVYGDPVYDQTVSVSLNGVSKNQTINNVIVIGNDYNIRIDYKIRPSTTQEIANVSVKMLAVCTNASIGSDINGVDGFGSINITYFNETESGEWRRKDYPVKFTSNANLTLFFNVFKADLVESVEIRIRIYQNPNRYWYELLNRIGLILAIPGFIVIICGACVAGNSGKSGSGMSKSRTIRSVR